MAYSATSPYSVRYDDLHIKMDTPDGVDTQHRIVRLGHIDLVFSYESLVAFRENIRPPDAMAIATQYPDRWEHGGWVMRENQWGKETTKHMSYYGVPVEGRIPEWDFWTQFRGAMLHPRMLLHFLALETLEELDGL